MKLSDLNPGDEFEYVYTIPVYHQGKFLVLDTVGSYLRPAAKVASRFIFSYATKKVVNHFVELEIIKKGANVKSQKQMGHFVGWKFGVPVKVNAKCQKDQNAVSGNSRLIDESNSIFIIVVQRGGVVICNKDYYSYELIPHRYNYSGGSNEPRYPICISPKFTAFCNSLNEIVHLEALFTKTHKFVPIPPAATITIDGKTIELSAETTANFKEQLGI